MSCATDVLKQSVVVFSKNYLPVSKINIKRAIVLLISGKAEPLEALSAVTWEVRSSSSILHVPASIRLKINSIERVWKVPAVNRQEVLKRDHYQCQYCGSKKQLTIDHVLPRSRGGKHTWDNVVIACTPCNALKGDRTPQEAGLKLKNEPITPIHPALAFAEQFWRQQQVAHSFSSSEIIN